MGSECQIHSTNQYGMSPLPGKGQKLREEPALPGAVLVVSRCQYGPSAKRGRIPERGRIALRHCERSEAIQLLTLDLDCFGAHAPRNDENGDRLLFPPT